MKSLLTVLFTATILSSNAFAQSQANSELSVEVRYCSQNSGFNQSALCAIVYNGIAGIEMPIDDGQNMALRTALAQRILGTGGSMAFVVSGHIVSRVRPPGSYVNVLVVESIVLNPSGPRPRGM